MIVTMMTMTKKGMATETMSEPIGGRAAYMRAYRKKKKDQINKQRRIWYAENHEHARKTANQYRADNAAHIEQRNTEKWKERFRQYEEAFS